MLRKKYQVVTFVNGVRQEVYSFDKFRHEADAQAEAAFLSRLAHADGISVDNLSYHVEPV